MTSGDTTESALAALTVLDLSEGVAGPFAAQLFADHGARVVKVERPGHGDRTRNEAPFTNDAPAAETSLPDLYLNPNKESLTLDFETAAGAAILARLLEDADGLIEDAPARRRPGLGLDAASLLYHIPRLVICQVSAFLAAGPNTDRTFAAFGSAGAALTGLHAFAAMLAALWNAAQTEHGQVIEVDASLALASSGYGQETSPPTPPVSEVRQPPAGSLSTPHALFELAKTPSVAGTAPLPGEHTEQVLGEIGFDAAAIEALRREGVV